MSASGLGNKLAQEQYEAWLSYIPIWEHIITFQEGISDQERKALIDSWAELNDI